MGCDVMCYDVMCCYMMFREGVSALPLILLTRRIKESSHLSASLERLIKKRLLCQLEGNNNRTDTN